MSSSVVQTPTYQAKTTSITNANNQSLQAILEASPVIVFRPDFNTADAVAGKAINHCVLFKDYSTSVQSTTLADHIKVNIKAGTIVRIGETFRTFGADTAVSWLDSAGAAVTATAGKDYAVYVKADGTTYLKDVTDGAFPVQRESVSGQAAVLLGGFHVGHVGASAALGANNTSAFPSGANNSANAGTGGASAGMGWTQNMLNRIKVVNAYSLWDMAFMPKNREPRGMAFSGNVWVGIYAVNALAGTSGVNFRRLSRYSAATKLASGEAGAIPTDIVTGSAFPNFNWWSASEIVQSLGGELMSESVFTACSQGVLEATSLGGASTTPIMSDIVDNRFTSWLGCHGMTGCLWTWGSDAGTRSATVSAGWKTNDWTGDRGQQYMVLDDSLARVLLGGHRSDGAISGSRCSNWNGYPRDSNWYIGVRAACGPL